ncbi:MAG: nuclear transport factor 2 family protein [Myxococcota bacterium]
MDRFRDAFAQFDPAQPFPVDEVYAPDVVFEDPAHRMEGREALRAYFHRLNRNVRSIHFGFDDDLRGEGRAALSWTMEIKLKVGPRRSVVVPGTSWLRHDESFVTLQRDHFDLGALVYEQVPVVGSVIRLLRRAL